MVMNANQTFGGEHTIEYTDIELQSCIPESYIMLLTNVVTIKKKCEKNCTTIQRFKKIKLRVTRVYLYDEI